MRKILITGCAGYIGSVATDLFLKNGYAIVGVDDFQTGYRQVIEVLKNKYKNFSFYERDLKEKFLYLFFKTSIT